MNNKKRLMILGASYSQIPLIRAANKLGVTTIAASIPGPYAGFEEADETVYVDISDPQAVLEAAEKAQIDGVCTCGLDLGMKAIGVVCEKLGLPGPTARAALLASDKWEMKKALTKAGLQTAAFFCIHNEEELRESLTKLSFPVILKATDQMGSRGIYRCDNEAEVFENYPKTMASTQKDYCLIEEFIVGELFGTEAMIQNGQIVYMLPNNTEALIGATPTPVGHSVPWCYEETLGEQLREQIAGAIRTLGLDNCPVNCDLIRRDDKVYIVEMTGRSGATGLSEMTGLYYGVDYYEMIVRCALGMSLDPSLGGENKTAAVLTHTLSSDVAGVVREIVNDNEPAEDIKDLSFNIEPGDEVRLYTNGRDRIGQVILTGDSLKGCQERLKEILSRIHIVV